MRGHQMRRRDVITLLGGAAAAWPLDARAQRGIPVIGYLGVGPPFESNVAGLRKGLAEQGYDEGRNIAIVFRNTEQYDRLPALAAELVRLRVAVIRQAADNPRRALNRARWAGPAGGGRLERHGRRARQPSTLGVGGSNPSERAT